MNRTSYIQLVMVLSMLIACQSQQSSTSEKRPTWVKLGPGGGGSTFLPSFSYHHSGTFLLRCDMTGTYLSKTGGNSYHQVNFPGGSSAFAFDPSDSMVVYIGSKTLQRSLDGGSSWEQIFPQPDKMKQELYRGDHADYTFSAGQAHLENIGQERISNIKVDPSGDKLYFSVGKQFYSTKNQGTAWNLIELEEPIAYIFTNQTDLSSQILVFTPDKLYTINKEDGTYSDHPFPEAMTKAFSFAAGTNHQGRTILYGLSNDVSLRQHGGEAPTALWTSTDLGNSWQQLDHELLTNKGQKTPTYSKLAVSEFNGSVVYLLTSSYQELGDNGKIKHWYGSLKSIDAGKNWEWVWKGGGGSGQYAVRDGQDAQNLEDSWVKEAFGGEYIRIIDVGVAPDNPEVAIVTDWYRAMKTTDGGKNWVEIYSKPQHEGYSSRGLDVTTAYGVHFDPFDPEHIAISYTDIGYHHSYDGGKSWIRSTHGIPAQWHNTCYWMVFDSEVENKIWSVWSGLHDFPRGKMTRNPKWKENGRGGVAISEDGGRSWEPSVKGMGFDSPATSIVLDPHSAVESRTLYVSVYGKGVFKSTDGGMSWTLKNQGISGSLAAFELTLLPDGTLYLITSPTPKHLNENTSREVFFGSVYKSVDGANSWQRLDIGEKVLFPNGLSYDPSNPERIYLGAWGDIQLSDLVGGSVARETGGNEWYDLEGGILVSEDGGDSWSQIFDPEHYVYDVTVDPEDPNRLYCNTFNRGAYRSDDRGKSWKKIAGYDFHWGHRVIIDPHQKEKVYLTTFGSSVWHGMPVAYD